MPTSQREGRRWHEQHVIFMFLDFSSLLLKVLSPFQLVTWTVPKFDFYRRRASSTLPPWASSLRWISHSNQSSLASKRFRCRFHFFGSPWSRSFKKRRRGLTGG